MNDRPKLAILGAGSIGLYYGTLLQQQGFPIQWILRSAYPLATREGLQVITPRGHFRSKETFFPSPEDCGPVDGIIIALKTTANRHLQSLLNPLVQPGKTFLLTLQNGLGQEELLADLFPKNPIAGGLCFNCITRPQPNTAHSTIDGKITLAWHQPPETAPDPLPLLFKDFPFPNQIQPNLREARWRKLIWNIPFNGLAVVHRADTEKLLADPTKEATIRRLMAEVISLAASEGFNIPWSFAEDQIAATRKMGPYQPSTLIDFLNHLPIEKESIWEIPLAISQQNHIPCPELTQLLSQLQQAIALQ